MIFFDVPYTLCIVLIGVTILGFTTGALGVFAFLRGSSLLGDAISHAAFPGIGAAFLITLSKNPLVLLSGGAVAGIIGALVVRIINSKTTLSQDAALGIVLSVFFGIGLVILSIIQRTPIARQAILNKFLFGSASTLLASDLYYITIIALCIFIGLLIFWKQCMVTTFDSLFAATIGYNVNLIDALLTLFFVCAIMIGLQTIGVILMSSFFVAPAAAAYQWTSRLSCMVVLAGVFGASAGAAGSLISYFIDHIPTGPAIVVVMSIIVMCSLLKSSLTRMGV